MTCCVVMRMPIDIIPQVVCVIVKPNCIIIFSFLIINLSDNIEVHCQFDNIKATINKSKMSQMHFFLILFQIMNHLFHIVILTSLNTDAFVDRENRIIGIRMKASTTKSLTRLLNC